MKRVDAPGHDDGKFTEGNPALGIPATVLSASMMNNIMEELISIVDDAGTDLDENDYTQVLDAVKTLIGRGGSEYQQDLLDAQDPPADITSLVFDKTKVKSVKILVDVFRRNDTQSANEMFELWCVYDPEGDTWALYYDAHGDDSGVIFNITAAGQVKYKSTAYAGTNYTGKLRITNVRQVRLTIA